MGSYLETETDKTENLQKFIDKVKKITELKELTLELIHEFIDKIIVYAPRYLDGKRVQVMSIHYISVGAFWNSVPKMWKKHSKNNWQNGNVTKQKRHSQQATPLKHNYDST